MNPDMKTQGYASFDSEFSVIAKRGTFSDPSVLSTLLPTLAKAAMSCGDELQMGTFLRLNSWRSGRGIVFDSSGETRDFSDIQGIKEWHDLDESIPHMHAFPTIYPALPSHAEIFKLLPNAPGVKWFATRYCQDTHGWQYHLVDTPLAEPALQQAVLMVMQVDVLLKEFQLPWGRLRFDYDEAVLYLWTNHSGDHLMLCHQHQSVEHNTQRLLLIGEAFVS